MCRPTARAFETRRRKGGLLRRQHQRGNEEAKAGAVVQKPPRAPLGIRREDSEINERGPEKEKEKEREKPRRLLSRILIPGSRALLSMLREFCGSGLSSPLTHLIPKPLLPHTYPSSQGKGL